MRRGNPSSPGSVEMSFIDSKLENYMLKFILLLASGSVALAQQYTISTIAGGAPPATPSAAVSTPIGQPQRVATDAAGNVYFSSANAVFKMNSAGTLTRVAGNSRAGFSGDGGPAVNAQLNSPQGIAVDSAGNVYIADSVNNRVRIVTASGIINTFAGNGLISPGGPRSFGDGGPATSAVLHLPQGVAVDSSGNVYIADTGDNCIRIVTPDGYINNFAGDSYPSFAGDGGNAENAEMHSPSDIALDSSGNLYIADTSNGRIRKVTRDGVINSVVGNGTIGYSGDGGAPLSAELLAPISVAVDSSGNIYIVENGDSRIRKVDSKYTAINTIAGTGVGGFSGDGSSATKAALNSPTGIAVDGSGNLYIADALNLRVRKIASGNINSVAGNGAVSYSGDGGPAMSAQLNAPESAAMDSAGNLYIADTANNVVREVAKSGIITTFAGNGTAGGNGDGGAATSAQLNAPQGVAVDSSGNVYIADTANGRVRKVSASGTISTVAGSGAIGYGGDGGAATSAQLYTPSAVAVDAAGNLYIADFSNNRIRKVSTSGTITTVAGNGNSGFTGDGGPATSANLDTPSGVAVDAAGNIYIADTGNNRIRQVNASGLITTVAGNGLPGFSGDGGVAVIAQLGNPASVAVDSSGNLYVADGGAHVRKIYASGFIFTIAGTGTPGYSGDGGLASNAQLNIPSGISLDSAGNVYVADQGNNAVRLLQPTTSNLKIGAVTNGASNLMGAITPGEVVVIYGSGMGPSQLVQAQLNSSGLVPTSVGGTSVFFNNSQAPVLYSSANQVAAIVPFGVVTPTAQVAVVYQGQVSAPATLNIASTSPAFFTLSGSGSGQVLAINQGGVLNDASHAAAAGSYITLYATGAGLMNPTPQDGQPGTAPLPQPNLQVTATIGGKPATVQYAGGAQGIVAGVLQVNIQVPSGLAPGSVPIVLMVGGVPSPSGVTVAVSN
jgi:uncharacterized protein (TIGR03437 family)